MVREIGNLFGVNRLACSLLISFVAGMRNSSAVILHIDLITALRSGVPFFLASNGAVLTAGEADSGLLPMKYVSRVEEAKTGKILWQPSSSNEEEA